MSNFFAFVPKKSKHLRTENTTIRETPVIIDETPSASNNSYTSDARMSARGGAFSTLDRSDEAV